MSALLAPQAAVAAQTVPYKVNFQGRLTDNSGNILTDGLYNIKFRLFDAASAGTNKFEEDRIMTGVDNRIQITNGLFNIQFGDLTALSPTLFSGVFPLFLEVELPTPATATCATNGCAVFTEGAMTPRQPMASSPYAFNSDTLDGLDSASFAQLATANTYTGANLFTPGASAVVGLTVKASTGGATNGLEVFDSANVRQAFFNPAGSLNVGQTIQPTTNNAVDLGVAGTAFRTLFAAGFDTGTVTTALTIGASNAASITIGKAGLGVSMPGGITTSNGTINTGSGSITTTGAIGGGAITGTSLTAGAGTVTGGNYKIGANDINTGAGSPTLSNVDYLDAAQSISATKTFTKAGGSGAIYSGTAASGAAIIQFGSVAALSAGSANGTYIGSNPAAFTGDFANFQIGSAVKFKVDNAGAVTAGAITGTSLSAGSGTIGTTGAINGGAITGTSLSAGSGTISTTGISSGGVVNATTKFQANGVDGVGSTCGAGAALTGATITTGILTAAGSCTTFQAAGNYIVQSPAGTANTITAASGAQAVIIKGTNGTGAHLMDIYNTAVSPVLTSYFDQNGALTTTAAITAPTTVSTINGLIVNAGALSGISTISTSGAINGATLSGGSLSAGTFSGGTVSGGTLTGTAVNGINVSTTAISVVAAATGLTIDAGTTGTISIGAGSTGDVWLAGGSGVGNGCTVTNSNGNFACTGTINGATISGGSLSSGTFSGGTVSGGSLSATAVNGLNISSGTIAANLSPDATFTRDLGAVTNIWKNLYVSNIDAQSATNTALTVGTAATTTAITIGRAGVAVSLPGGLTTSNGTINTGSGSITTTGSLSAAAIIGTSLGLGTGNITTTGTIGAGVITGTSLATSSNGTINSGSGTISTTGAVNSGTHTLASNGATAAPVLNFTGTPLGGIAAAATTSLVSFGGAIAGGNQAANGGTYLGLNLPAASNGSAADFLNFQKNGTVEFKVDNSGNGTLGGGLTVGTGSVAAFSTAGLIQNAAIDSTVTYSNLQKVGTISTGTWQGTAVGVLYGGTGQTTYTDGQLLIGNTTGNTLTKATLTGTANRLSITNGGGSISLNVDTTQFPSAAGASTILKSSGANAASWVANTQTNVCSDCATTTLNNVGSTSIPAALVASANNTQNLGAAATVWQNVYTGNLDAGTTTTALTVGMAATTTAITIGRSGLQVNIPGGLTTSGSAIATANGALTLGSGNLTTTGTIGAGAITGTSLNAGSGTISTTGAVSGGSLTFQPTTDIRTALIKQSSVGSPTADIFNLQTAAGANLIQATSAGSLMVNATAASTWSTSAGDLTVTAGANLILDAATASTIRIGTATNNLTFAATTREPSLNGTAQHTRQVMLAPEFPGATLAGSGSNNAGNMTASFCSGTGKRSLNTAVCTVSTDQHVYYQWTPTVASPAQTFDVFMHYQLPSDYSSMLSNTTLQMYGWRTGAGESVTLYLYQANGTLCGTATNVATGTGTWTQTNYTATYSSCTLNPGDVVLFDIKMSATSATDFARAGELNFSYRSKW